MMNETNQMIALKTPQMSTNLVISMPEDVQAKLDELVADSYALDDMIAFIEEYGNDNFIQFYEEYVENGENYSYDAVDAFVDEFGIDCIAHFTDAYYGQYDSEEEFAEQYVSDCYAINLNDTPVIVYLSATWNTNLQYDFAFNDGFLFNKNY
jgi:hypothetical protein